VEKRGCVFFFCQGDLKGRRWKGIVWRRGMLRFFSVLLLNHWFGLCPRVSHQSMELENWSIEEMEQIWTRKSVGPLNFFFSSHICEEMRKDKHLFPFSFFPLLPFLINTSTCELVKY
jgi:hypothetical protein